MMKVYRPITTRTGLTNENINKINTYSYQFSNRMFMDENSRKLNSTNFFNSIKNAYKKVTPDMKAENFFNNQIAADIGYGIYHETNNSELALRTMKSVHDSIVNNKVLSTQMFNNVLGYMQDGAFKGLLAQKYFPMISIKQNVASRMNGGDEEAETKKEEDENNEENGETSLKFEWGEQDEK